MSGVTYRDGIAVILDRARETKVFVPATANLVLARDIELTKADMLGLAAGFHALHAECQALREELAAARAGQVGKEHAEAMQGARKVIADLRLAGERFLVIYDSGDAPDGDLDEKFRDAVAGAESWLIADSSAATERAKVLKGGAA